MCPWYVVNSEIRIIYYEAHVDNIIDLKRRERLEFCLLAYRYYYYVSRLTNKTSRLRGRASSLER